MAMSMSNEELMAVVSELQAEVRKLRKEVQHLSGELAAVKREVWGGEDVYQSALKGIDGSKIDFLECQVDCLCKEMAERKPQSLSVTIIGSNIGNNNTIINS